MSQTRVGVTNPDRVLWPDVKITKVELIDYYQAVGHLLLQELKDRLLTLVRAPGGVGGETFFQKNAPKYTPDWIKTKVVYAASAKRDVRFLICNSIDTLVWIGNQAGLELHPCLDRDSLPGRPDMLVFDMDPVAGRFEMSVEAALVMRDVLQNEGLEPLVKTTGGKGLHVYVRIERRYGFDRTHAFAWDLARRAVQRADGLMTTEFKKGDRGGRVFVDVHRNGPGATLISAFSPRARVGAPVSFPITWEEVSTRSPNDYNLHTAGGLLGSPGVKAWIKGLKDRHRLPRL